MSMSLLGTGNTVFYDTGWSAQARILPYLEGGTLFSAANIGVFKEDPTNATVISLTVSTFICPSEVRPEVSTHDYGRSGVINYGLCGGDWFVWGGFNGPYNRQAFGPNRSLKFAAITDGLSQTVFAAEVKAYQPSSNCRFTTLQSVTNPNNIPSPDANPFQVAPEYDNGYCMTINQFEFHTEWSDGHVHAAGFTTAWPPNKAVIPPPGALYAGWDIDLNGMNEENGGPTFSAINARCYHPGGVNALLGDGSVRFVRSTMNGMLWRALGTVGGGDLVPGDAY